MSDVIIRDLGLDQITKDSEELGRLSVKVGLPKNGDVGEPTSIGSGEAPVDDMSEMVQIGAVHEYGAPKKNIEQRSWLRSAVDENRTGISDMQQKIFEAVVFGRRMSPKMGTKVLGEYGVSIVKKKITKLKSPSLSEKTIKRKRSSNPLIDTAQMRNSIQYELEGAI